MFGSIVLDVVIGLVFIYLLYSLLATVISELLATILGLRARNLRQGIARMLEDEPQRKKGFLFNTKIFLFLESLGRGVVEFIVPTKGAVLDHFYQQPNIKYLAAGRYFSKPSYISAANFSKALLEMLKKEGLDGNTDLEKVTKALTSHSATKDQLEAIRRLLEDPTGNDAQKVAGITLLLQRYAVDTPLFRGETSEHLVSLLSDAQNDLVKFKGLLEKWFDDTMERVTGWYKRTIQILLLMIGFVLAVTFNANTLEIVNILSTDKDARKQMVQMASAYVKENEELIDLYRKSNPDSSAGEKKAFNDRLDSLLKIKNKLETDIESVNQVMGFQPPDSIPYRWIEEKSIDSVKRLISNRQKLLGDSVLIVFPSAYLAMKTSGYYQVENKKRDTNTLYYAPFNRWAYICDNFWGYLLTALAISLGAPFWFDLLNKLVKLRSSVQQKPPQPSAGNAKAGEIPLDQRVG